MKEFEDLAVEISKISPFDVQKVSLMIKTKFRIMTDQKTTSDHETELERLSHVKSVLIRRLNTYNEEITKLKGQIAKRVVAGTSKTKVEQRLHSLKKDFGRKKFDLNNQIREVNMKIESIQKPLNRNKHDTKKSEAYDRLLKVLKMEFGEEKTKELTSMARKGGDLL